MVAARSADRELRDAAVRRLTLLEQRNELTTEHVRMVASTFEVAERTVWRWIARDRGQVVRPVRDRFSIDDRLRVRLAYWRGNATALHRELIAEHRADGPAVPSWVPGAAVSPAETGRAVPSFPRATR